MTACIQIPRATARHDVRFGVGHVLRYHPSGIFMRCQTGTPSPLPGCRPERRRGQDGAPRRADGHLGNGGQECIGAPRRSCSAPPGWAGHWQPWDMRLTSLLQTGDGERPLILDNCRRHFEAAAGAPG